MLQLDWNATVDVIRETLPTTQFQNWIKPVAYLRHDARSVVLGVPSRFHEEWLRSHYSQQLRTAIHKQCGTELQLEFEILATTPAGTVKPNATLVTPPSSPKTSFNAYPMAPAAPTTAAPTRPTLRVVETKPSFTTVALEPAKVPQTPPPPSEVPTIPPAPELPIFEHPFVELNYNMVAYQCAGIFTQGRNSAINPLILQGAVGMGKTHLLTEIGRWIHKSSPSARVRYTNAEAFTNEMVTHLKTDNILTFKRKYGAETDVLLFDDIQGLAGRAKTQETLLHVFNEITQRGGRIAFTVNCSIARIGNFIDPLRSRLHSGVIAEIREPTYEERVQLLGKMCQHHRIAMDPTAVRCLADKGQSDVRELIGSLLRVHLQAKIQNRPVDSEYVTRQSAAVAVKRESVSMSEIIALVEHNFGVPKTELVSKSRKGATTWARQVAMYLARTYTLLPLEEIGRSLGRDHATVIHAFTKVTETMASQPHRRYEVEFLKSKLSARVPSSGATATMAPADDRQPTLFDGAMDGDGSRDGVLQLL